MAGEHDELITQFCALAGCTPEQATQYLSSNDWNLEAAAAAFFQDQDSGDDEPAAAAAATPAAAEPEYTGPRTLDGRPAPHSSSNAASSRAQPKKKGIATLGSLGSGGHSHAHDHDDEDEDDEDFDDGNRGDLFAGGEKSGLAVQDPKQAGSGAKKIIEDILAKAKANASRPTADASVPGASSSRFTGSGQTVGGDGVASRTIPDPLAAARASTARVPPTSMPQGEPQERTLHLWRDGFSIDDGPLRRFDDPENARDLAMIRQGRAPLHLMNVQIDQPVDVKLQQHEENFRQLPRIYRPFGGSGRRLGSPVPGEAALSAPPPAPSPLGTSSSTASAGAGTSSAVDESQPTLTLRIQMPDGTRLPARFNTTQTLDDVYQFVSRASVAAQAREWVLATTFPNKEHRDRSLVLGDIPEFKKGGTAVVKWT